MVFITEDLVRKRAEHNELEIGSLEEISLHQLDIEKIEHLDKWCKKLKILYLHNNLIFKIENVSRMKSLEYLNLTLNCIEKIENLEGCESLNKLDLTANFLGDITHIDVLTKNRHLRTVYLTGNPCVKYEHYRAYVIDVLPQISELDGESISISERLTAKKMRQKVHEAIKVQSRLYREKREKQKFERKMRETKTGDDFWNEVDEDSPEGRFEMHIEAKKQKENENEHTPMFKKEEYKREIRFFSKDGRPLNVNQANIDFILDEERPKDVLLRLKLPKFLDTQAIEIDSQPKYIKILINGKAFQLVWRFEVMPDLGTAQRSTITGEMKIVIPKLHPEIVKKEPTIQKPPEKIESVKPKSQTVDYKNIVKENAEETYKKPEPKKREIRENDPNFIDDDDVPPLF